MSIAMRGLSRAVQSAVRVVQRNGRQVSSIPSKPNLLPETEGGFTVGAQLKTRDPKVTVHGLQIGGTYKSPDLEGLRQGFENYMTRGVFGYGFSLNDQDKAQLAKIPEGIFWGFDASRLHPETAFIVDTAKSNGETFFQAHIHEGSVVHVTEPLYQPTAYQLHQRAGIIIKAYSINNNHCVDDVLRRMMQAVKNNPKQKHHMIFQTANPNGTGISKEIGLELAEFLKEGHLTSAFDETGIYPQGLQETVSPVVLSGLLELSLGSHTVVGLNTSASKFPMAMPSRRAGLMLSNSSVLAKQFNNTRSIADGLAVEQLKASVDSFITRLPDCKEALDSAKRLSAILESKGFITSISGGKEPKAGMFMLDVGPLIEDAGLTDLEIQHKLIFGHPDIAVGSLSSDFFYVPGSTNSVQPGLRLATVGIKPECFDQLEADLLRVLDPKFLRRDKKSK